MISTASCSSTRRALERIFIPRSESAASPLSAIGMDMYEAATYVSAIAKMARDNFMVIINKSNNVMASMRFEGGRRRRRRLFLLPFVPC